MDGRLAKGMIRRDIWEKYGLFDKNRSAIIKDNNRKVMVCGMMAEIEYMLIKERAAEGVKIAKDNKKMGRPKRILNQTEMGVLED